MLGLAWACVGCLTTESPEDRFAGVVGGTILDGGRIVIIPATPLDASTDARADMQDASAAQSDAGAGGTLDAEQGPPLEGCDFRGRWLVSDRFVANGMNIQQATFAWRYFEMDQQGGRIEVTRGLLCGKKTVPLGSLGVNIDFTSQQESMLTREREDGREGLVSKTASGCELSFPKRYSVSGATLPYYLDPAAPLPTAAERGDTTRPGWEDWDNDGKPGVATKVRGFANGTIHLASRTHATWTGAVPTGSDNFKLTQVYGFQNSVLLIEGSELLATNAGVDPDASLHFVRFVKLSDAQAAGSDDAAVCAEIRRLAPELAPDANR